MSEESIQSPPVLEVMKLKQWWSERRRCIQRQKWEYGFSWAAGQLLLEQETPQSIQTKCESSLITGKDNPFDRGALMAVRILRDLGTLDAIKNL